MYATDVAVIGAGQAGLAMSRCLSGRGIDHVVFERGQVGARWQSHAWDSLRLLTPNWLNGLPGSPYQGDDPDGFMRRGEFLARLQGYAAGCAAPVMPQTDVLSVLHERGAFLVSTSGGSWRARAVVVATGHCDVPFIPAVARSLSRRVLNLHSSQYRSPLGIPEGGVLVVGASASGVQIADELRRGGREVTLAVGRHTRAPRMWRGHDIFWWMERAGILGERTRDLPDADAARRQPALQLAGRPDRSNVDLCTLQAMGVRLAGRVVAAMGDRIAFADDLPAAVTLAQAKLERLLARIDAFAGFGRDSPHDAIAPVDLSRQAPLQPVRRGRECPHGGLGDRLPPHLSLARRGGRGRTRWRDRASRRRHRRAGSLRSRIPPAAQARFAFHRWRRLGRGRAGAADCGLARPIRKPRRLTAREFTNPCFTPQEFEPHYDAIIVGARCAGAATAMLLAEAGLSVLAVDRQSYGSDTLSTHALMRPAVMQLSRWGLLQPLLRSGAPVIALDHLSLWRAGGHGADPARAWHPRPDRSTPHGARPHAGRHGARCRRHGPARHRRA